MWAVSVTPNPSCDPPPTSLSGGVSEAQTLGPNHIPFLVVVEVLTPVL